MTENTALAPTDTEIDVIADQHKASGHGTVWPHAFARAVLPKWGTPPAVAGEPVAIYHGRCTIDCGEHGHLDMELLKMIPAGSKLYTAPQPAQAQDARFCYRSHPHEHQDTHCQLREVSAWLRWHASACTTPSADSMRLYADQVDAVTGSLLAAPAQPVTWPRNAAEVHEFMDAHCQREERANDDSSPSDDDLYALTAYNFLSAVNSWADSPRHPGATQPATQPAAQALDADLWYLQDTRSYVGNDVAWWAKDGKGFTTDVSKAHVYGREEASRQAAMRGTDRAWPKAYIDGKTRPAVDMQYIDHAAAIAAQKGATT